MCVKRGLNYLLLSFCLIAFAGGPASVRAQTVPTMTRLSDGVRLILKPETETEFVALCVFVQTKQESEPRLQAVADVTARAVFYGSLHQSYDSVTASLVQVGGLLETFQSPECVAFVCVTVPSQIREAIYLLSEALKNADFSADALEHARQDMAGERRLREASPFEAAFAQLRQHLRGETLPDDALLQRVTPAQARAYFASHYVPARTVISVAGRFPPRLVETLFDAELYDFERVAPAQPLPPAPTAMPAVSEPKPLTLAVNGGAQYAFAGTDAPPVTSPDYPAFEVLHTLLGVGHASRLFARVREAEGTGYSVGAEYRVDRGEPLVAYAQWGRKPKDANGAGTASVTAAHMGKLLLAQIRACLDAPPTNAELERARQVAIVRDALRHERTREQAFLPGWYECVGLGWDFDSRLPALLENVTAADVQRVARRYLAAPRLCFAVPASP